ncbi:MAG: hypothetical protein BGO49_15860 [Planctomycetales bacterium 71-10]|nr:MAG: hypothetical protein BGO49_15860 [Planctomycetales bacterium 71-10]
MSSRLGLGVLLIALFPALVRADAIYDYHYTGVVTSVSDDYGLFGDVPVGAQVSGDLRLVGPATGTPVLDLGVTYIFPVGPGVGNVFNAIVDGRTFEASQGLAAIVTNSLRYTNPGTNINGGDDPSKLDASGVPDDEYLANLSIHLFFRFPAGQPGTYPDLPTSLLPLSQYGDFPVLSGSVTAYTNDSDDDTASTSTIQFRITSLTAVPEPTSIVSCALGLAGLAGRALRRRPTVRD